MYGKGQNLNKKQKNILLISIVIIVLIIAASTLSLKNGNNNSNNNNEKNNTETIDDNKKNKDYSNVNDKVKYEIKDKIVFESVKDYVGKIYNNSEIKHFDIYVDYNDDENFEFSPFEFSSKYNCGDIKIAYDLSAVDKDTYIKSLNDLKEFNNCNKKAVDALNDGIDESSSFYTENEIYDSYINIRDFSQYLYYLNEDITEKDVVNLTKYLLNEGLKKNSSLNTNNYYVFVYLYPIYIKDKFVDLQIRYDYIKNELYDKYDDIKKVCLNNLKTSDSKYYYDKYGIIDSCLSDSDFETRFDKKYSVYDFDLNRTFEILGIINDYFLGGSNLYLDSYAKISYLNDVKYENNKLKYVLSDDYFKKIIENPSVDNIIKIAEKYGKNEW